MTNLAIGVDLGGTSIKAALINRDSGIVELRSSPTLAHEGPDKVIDRISMLINDLSAEAVGDSIGGIGIGAPGAVNWERDTVINPPNLDGWQRVNLQVELQDRLRTNLPVIVENDANVAGLGSAHYGAGAPHNSFIFVTLGTGVGGVIVYNNKVFRGATGGAGEIGHMTIDYEGPIDHAGVAGSIEAYIGQRFLSKHAKYRLHTKTNSLIHKMTNGDLNTITPKILYEAAEKGDEGAIEVLSWAGHKLGCVLGSAVNLLDIRKLIIGGGVSAAGSYILKPAYETLVRFVIPGLRDGLEIIRETLGNEAGILGAAHLVFEYLDEHSYSA
ncbi:MAG: ROK family protein [Rhodothermaceae bacterium]|nr:ROK family protein [Rhodothermaceae bacterium]